jgi:hypothetical protein
MPAKSIGSYHERILSLPKGKGQLQTYWVKHGRVRQGESNGRRKKNRMMNQLEQHVTKMSPPADYDYEKAGDRIEPVGQWMKTSMMTLESTIESPLAGDKTARLVDWNVDILTKVVKKRERTMPLVDVEQIGRKVDGARSFRLRRRVKVELHD